MIKDLFGYAQRDASLPDANMVIFTGPNGSGKTHTLRVIECLLNLNVSRLRRLPIAQAELHFSDGTSVGVGLRRDADQGSLVLWVRPPGVPDDLRTQVSLSGEEITELELELINAARQFERVGPKTYRDRARGERVHVDQLRELYADSLNVKRKHLVEHVSSSTERSPKLRQLVRYWPNISCITIDTKRLDAQSHSLQPDLLDRRPYGIVRGEELAASRIEGYLSLIHNQIEAARIEAIRQNQNSDASFAARALNAAHAAINEDNLRDRYARLVARSEALSANLLHFGEAPPTLKPAKLNPTEKRILSVFLDDWEKRMDPLEPVSQRIDLLRSLLDRKLLSSYKKTKATDRGVAIASSHGKTLRVTELSSGEQHLVALFTRLIFGPTGRSVILIDEPEISLHPAWQHEFIEDLERISEGRSMQTIVATHSPSIVNGHWDLEVALSLPEPPPSREQSQEDETGIFDDLFEELSDG